MDAKSSKKSFDTANSIEIPEIGYKETLTHHELVIKVERYKPFFQKQEDFRQLEKILKDYLDREGSKHIVRAKRDQVFGLGQRTGLSPGTGLTDIYKGDEVIDEVHRQKIAEDVKKLYRKNFSVLKMFVPSALPIEKMTPMVSTEEYIKIKIPHKVKSEEQKQSKQKHFNVTERFGHASGSKNQIKSKTTKENQPNHDVNGRFNMASKTKEESKRLKNYNVYKTANKNNKVKPKEKTMDRDM